MTHIRHDAARLRDECERLARLAEQSMLDPALSDADRQAASDEAKVYWQLSRVHADDVLPSKFLGKNTGKQDKTLKRREFLSRIKLDSEAPKTFAARAYGEIEGKQLFSSEETILNFIYRNKL